MPPAHTDTPAVVVQKSLRLSLARVGEQSWPLPVVVFVTHSLEGRSAIFNEIKNAIF